MNKWDPLRNRCSAEEEVLGANGGNAKKQRSPGGPVTPRSTPKGVPGVSDPAAHSKKEGFQWVQCDACGKWRKIPASVDASKLPEKW